MNVMYGSFTVEGRRRGTYEVCPPESIGVSLMTDGQFVQIERQAADEGGSVGFTPKGWAQLAEHAAKLVTEANAAWERMGSTLWPTC